MPWQAVLGGIIPASSPGGLLGTGSRVSNNPFSNISPDQQALLQQLLGILSSGSTAPGVTPFSGQLVAPTQPILSTDFASILQQVQNELTGTGPQATTLNNASGSLNNILTGTGTDPAAEANFFQQTVAGPLEKTFQQQTMPALEGFFGQSAGGTSGSGFATASANAAGQLNDTLARDATALAFSTQQSDIKNRLAAAQAAPGVTGAPMQQLLQAIQAGQAEQQRAQLPLTAQFSEFERQQQQQQQIIQDFIASFAPNTQGLNTVVQPGQPGFFQSFLSGGGGSALVSAFA